MDTRRSSTRELWVLGEEGAVTDLTGRAIWFVDWRFGFANDTTYTDRSEGPIMINT
jgi:hypothetical protein